MKEKDVGYVIADKALLKIINEQDDKIHDIIGRLKGIIYGSNTEYYPYGKEFIVKCLKEIVDEHKEEE